VVRQADRKRPEKRTEGITTCASGAHTVRWKVDLPLSMAVTTRNHFAGRAAGDFQKNSANGVEGVSLGWRLPALLTAGCILLDFFVFHETVLGMVSTWLNSRTFSHCLLVFPLSVYMVWRSRRRIALLQPRPSVWGLLLLLSSSICWLLGNIGEIRVVQEFAWVSAFISLVWALLGTAVIRSLAFPLGFLFFSVPFGVSLIGPLQDFTAWMAVQALTLSGIPAVLEHRLLSVPSSTWTVAEACSGIRYLFSSVMAGVIYAKIVYRSYKRRLIFIFCAIIIPIVANGLRAYGIVLLAYLSNNRIAVNVDHVVYGWLFFAIVQIALFGIGLRWLEPGSASTSAYESNAGMQQAAAVVLPKRDRWQSLAVAFGIVAILALTPVAAQHLWSRADLTSRAIVWPDPPVVITPPWQAAPESNESWTPSLRGANRDFTQSYISGSRRVDLYCALYSGRGFELLNSYNRTGSPRTWAAIADNLENLLIDNKSVTIHRTLFISGEVTRWMWSWYWVNGEYTTSPERVKYLQAKARLYGASPITVVFALSTESARDESSAEDLLREFLTHASFLSPGSPKIQAQAHVNVQPSSSVVQDFSH